MIEMNQFISDSEPAIPPMSVEVINSLGKVVKKFDVPANFQLDKYADTIHPGNELMININNVDMTVSVCSRWGTVNAIYRGIFI